MVLDRVRSTLFATKLHAAATVVVALLVLLVLAFVLGFLGAPGVAGVENRFGTVNETTTTVESDVMVENPNPIDLRLGGTTVDYAVSMNGLRMAEGTHEGIAVETGTSTLNLTTHMRNSRIPDWWESHVRNGERTTLAVHADVHSSLLGATFGAPTIEREIETDITAGLNASEPRPVNAGLGLVSDPVLYVNETAGRWGEPTDTETPIAMTFTVYNPKSHPIPVSELAYDVTMNGVAVGQGASSRSVVVDPGETETVEARTVIRNEALDEWWVSHLRHNQVTELSIDFHARLNLTHLGLGTVRVPLDSTNQTVETDVFGTKPRNGGGTESGTGGGDESTPTDGGSPPSSTPTGGPTPTDAPTGGDALLDGGDDPTATPARAQTGSPTPTSTPTPTDESGLLD